MEDFSEQENIINNSGMNLKKIRLVFLFIFLIFLLVITVFYFKDKILIKFFKSDVISVDNHDFEASPFNKFIQKEVEQTLVNSSLHGKVIKHSAEKMLIVPKDEDSEERPRYDIPENRVNYLEGKYNIIDIPAQDYVAYVSGYFEGWEDIPESLDKYIIVKYPPSDDLIKFRVSFEESSLFSSDITFLLYLNSEERPDPKFSDFISLTFERVKDVFKNGDYLVVYTLSDPPINDKKDESGNYLASKVYIEKK